MKTIVGIMLAAVGAGGGYFGAHVAMRHERTVLQTEARQAVNRAETAERRVQGYRLAVMSSGDTECKPPSGPETVLAATSREVGRAVPPAAPGKTDTAGANAPTAGTTSGVPSGNDDPAFYYGTMGRMRDELHLSDDQVSKVRSVFRHWSQVTMEAAQTGKRMSSSPSGEELKSILTPEQFAKFLDKHQQMISDTKAGNIFDSQAQRLQSVLSLSDDQAKRVSDALREMAVHPSPGQDPRDRLKSSLSPILSPEQMEKWSSAMSVHVPVDSME